MFGLVALADATFASPMFGTLGGSASDEKARKRRAYRCKIGSIKIAKTL
jgi:hypothetical protein